MALCLAHPRSPVTVTAASGLPVAQPIERNVLITARLVLRPLIGSDERAFIAAVAAAGDLTEFCPLHRDGETDAQLFDRQLAMAAAATATGKAARLAITPADEPACILGAINLNSITRGLEARATVNWWLVPASRRRGIACEAAAALFEHAFADLPLGLGLDRIDGLIDPANFRSLRLAELLRMRAQPGQYERVMIGGEAKVHQLYSAFARLAPLPASMIELKPLRGLDAILRGAVRI